MHNPPVLDLEKTVAELNDQGFCVLRAHFDPRLLHVCRDAISPTLEDYLRANAANSNRGVQRHFMAMPWDSGCYAPEFFFDPDVLAIVRALMDDRVVADQWGCDVPLKGSEYQQFHADYQRPLFPERPELQLPPYMLTVSFGLVNINADNGAIEIAPRTHCIPRSEALQQIASGGVTPRIICLETGDVLLRHPWTLHRGTPNRTDVPRPLVTIRYVRRWYADESREVNAIPATVWQTFSPEQRILMRFPITDSPAF
jgi:ectoine hydroxylase-related dioxygenase (phytanoyl-CoA dioxygenase family)